MLKDYLQKCLEKRLNQGSLRVLEPVDQLIDFASNDYLGFAQESQSSKTRPGSGGARLITGDSQFAHDLEDELAAFFQTEAALLFNSGYDANLGLISSLGHKEHEIYFDELVHASIRDGLQLGQSKKIKFRHNDLVDLQEKLSRSSANTKIIVIESLYSMDGDLAPVREILKIAQQHQAELIIDEAHSTGIYGDSGAGIIQSMNIPIDLQELIFARVHTFGKAFGCHGAAVCGSSRLKKFLVNYARSFIYTTFMPEHSLQNIASNLNKVKQADHQREQLKSLSDYFDKNIEQATICQGTQIKSVIYDSIEKVKSLSQNLKEQGLFVKAILPPTVPSPRLRICLHSFNSKEEIDLLLESLNE